MLPAASRIRRREDFRVTLRRGRRAGAAALSCFLMTEPAQHGPDQYGPAMRATVDTDLPPPRAGFIVGRDVGPAAVRNRVRRRLRHLAASRLAALPPGSRWVVRASPNARSRSSAELGATLDRLLDRLLAAEDPDGGGRCSPDRSRYRRSPRGRGNLMRAVLLVLLAGYRRGVSPLLRPRCRYYPSCSAYAEQAIRDHGAVRGLLLTLRRLARCHPFAPGGVDPVPTRRTLSRPPTGELECFH